MCVVAASVDRVGYPRWLSVQVACDLDVLASGFVLARIQLPVPAPRPAGQQRAVVDVLGVRVEVFRRGDERGEYGYQPGSDPRVSPADGWLGSFICLCEFLLNAVPPHIGERYYYCLVKPERRRPRIDVTVLFICIYESAQVDDLVYGESGGMIHARPVSARTECGNPILSRSRPSFTQARRDSFIFLPIHPRL